MRRCAANWLFKNLLRAHTNDEQEATVEVETGDDIITVCNDIITMIKKELPYQIDKNQPPYTFESRDRILCPPPVMSNGKEWTRFEFHIDQNL